ncbi:helix-turn-helix transcriptional regulator [Kitasatospora sp. NBC_01287]|uniref:helix-turn-helix transcriptional regulator n=1 Tax=Kitasatospora sp. NBC_01287 TaxID=2903573 RepID=UPI00225BB5F3|nr:helix-turn-helix transcriptional regulator [Kitasatospora sp. NBC_01287]MCX4749088.1 helix-turn-helix transcriptional regulator [Kitasatospora sp. NBC_01287]
MRLANSSSTAPAASAPVAPAAPAPAPAAPAPAPARVVAAAAPSAPDVRRQELAAFLRSRRERISPEQVGLPSTGRRRTPGLRREEVAQLAAVGVTWYTWLEQGRDIQVSAQVLESVSRALLLDHNERTHLYILAGAGDPEPTGECAVVTPAVRVILDQLFPLPAWVLNNRYDVLAHNDMSTRLFGSFAELPAEERNLLWLIHVDPDYQRRWLDLDGARAQMTARLRAAMADHVADPAWKSLVARLRQASPDFEERWQRHEVMGRENGTKGFVHPEVGVLRLEFTNMWLGPQRSSRLVTYTPMDEESRARLALLAAK